MRAVETRFVPAPNAGTMTRAEHKKELLDIISENLEEFGQYVLEATSVKIAKNLKVELEFLRCVPSSSLSLCLPQTSKSLHSLPSFN
jgi:hypothetical protein